MIRIILQHIKSFLEKIATIFLRCLVSDKLNKSDYVFNIPENAYNPYLSDLNFLNGLNKAIPYTIISTCKFQTLYWALQECPDGDVIDIGVLRGGSSIFFATLLKDGHQVHCIDHWSEKKNYDSNFLLEYSDHSDLAIFRDATRHLQLNHKIRVFDEPFLSFCKNDFKNTISVIHFDIYDYTVFNETISKMLQFLVRGGCILIGGYGAMALPKLSASVNRAAKELRDISRFVHDKNGYGVFIKIL